MSAKGLGILLKLTAVLLVLLIGGGIWYYAFGRKPSLTLSTRIGATEGLPSAHLVGPGEVLLVVGAKAMLYDTATGRQRWAASLNAAASAQLKTAVQHVATPAPAPAARQPAPDAKPDPLLAKRVERRFAKLAAWAAKLNGKRGKLKTPIQIQAFNEEAAKYHAELAEARAEAAPLHRAQFAAAAALQAQDEEAMKALGSAFDFPQENVQVFAESPSIWIVRGPRAVGLDRANGRVMKEIPLAGDFEQVLRGPHCLYVISRAANGTRQVAAIATADGSSKAIVVAQPAGLSRYSFAGEGLPPTPNIQPARTEFSAAGGELLQVDMRLLQQKITERQVISGGTVADMEEADRKTKGGWGNDAMIIAQEMAKDAARQATGGKVLLDESTYEVTLRRPFSAGAAAFPPLQTEGRPEVFSTATLDLVVAGQRLIAFDHGNRKLWESKLANSLSLADAREGNYGEDADARTATPVRPCVEDNERLYLFDKGFLSVFDRSSGRPLWRLPSMGIRKLQLDGGGLVYVVSANRDLDAVGSDLGEVVPVTMKVDARSGKILWKLEKYEDCFVSGSNVYVTRETQNAEDLMNQVFDSKKAPETRFKLYKLSARDGKPQWEWFQTRRPLWIETEQKKVSLLFRDELQVIKSIAL